LKPGKLFARVAGVLLIGIPFIPLQTEAFGYVPPPEWLLGIFVFGSSAWLLARFAPSIPDCLLALLARLNAGVFRGRRLTVFVLAGLAFLLVLTSRVAFRHHPLLVDSVIQLFQAKIFASGQLAAPAPPAEAFVATQHMLVHEGRWFAQYPPGHALLLAGGILAGFPWLVPVLLSLGSAWLMVRFSSEVWGENAGRAVLVLIPFVPFFWFMGASFMNHVSCLFFVAAFLYAFQRWESGGAAGWALAAGAAIGAAGLVRPLTALAVAAVFAPVGLMHGLRARRYRSLGLAALGGFAAVATYAAFNAATTGDPLMPGYLQLWGAAHGIGFHPSPWGDTHTPVAGLLNEAIDLSLLSTFFLEWPIPALLPVGVYVLLTGGDRWDRRLLAGFLAVPAAYLFYWHRDAYLGPRFLFSGLVFLIPLTARALVSIRTIREQVWQPRRAAVVLVAMSFTYAAFYSAPRRLAGYESSFASMKIDPLAIAANDDIEHGVVFVAVSWGNRLLARMRQAGVSAATAEGAYRRSDHCELEQQLRRAHVEAWSGSRLDEVIAMFPSGGVKLEDDSPNGDPTLRLTPGRPLAAVCRAELAHDRAGYTNWLPFLLVNDPPLNGPVLFVRDLRDLNAEFLRLRPGRTAWLYRPGEITRFGSADRAE
jgi:hypothetical protein